MEKNRFIKTALCLVLAFAMTFAPIFSSYAMIATAFTGEVQAAEAQEPASDEDAASSDEETADTGQPAAGENAATSEETSETKPSAKTDTDVIKEQNQTVEEKTAEAAEPVEEEVKATRTEYVWKDDAVIVTASLSDPEAIPDDAEFVATPINKESTGYNYDAYMEALNKDSGSKYDESNTLLYDIAFIQDGIELQPESGTVSVAFDFLDKQLAESIGAKKASDISVIHLPLTDEIKDNYDTTADAKDINASDINVEEVTKEDNKLDVKLGGLLSNEKVAFELESFSAVAVTVPVTSREGQTTYDVLTPDTATFKDSSFNTLNRGDFAEIANFGLIAFSELYLNAHTNSNFAAKKVDMTNAAGTNRLKEGELFYIQDELTGGNNFNMTTGENGEGVWNGSQIVLGSGINLTSIDSPVGSTAWKFFIDDTLFNINGPTLENNAIRKEVEGDRFIDLEAYRTQAADLSKRYSEFTSTKISREDGEESVIIERNDATIASYNIDARDLTKKIVVNDDNVNTDSEGNLRDHVFIISIDAAGYDEIKIPGLTVTSSGYTGEVSKWTRGNVILNIYDSSKENKQYTGKVTAEGAISASILCPYASFATASNVNGQIIADKITIGGEFHRDSITFEQPITIKGGLKAAKELNGSRDLEDRVFNFKLTGLDGAPMPDDANNPSIYQSELDGLILFGYITFRAPGEYKYELEEVIPDDAMVLPDGRKFKDGIIYDTSKYTIGVISDYRSESDRTLVIKSYNIYKDGEIVDSIDYDAGKTGVVTFQNDESDGKASIQATKSFSGWSTESLSNKKFSIILEAKSFIDKDGNEKWSGNSPRYKLPTTNPDQQWEEGPNKSKTIEVSASNPIADFGKLSFIDRNGHADDSNLGTYTYAIKESIPAGATYSADGKTAVKDGIVYDATEHTVTVEFIKVGNKYLVTTTYDNDESSLTVTNDLDELKVEKKWFENGQDVTEDTEGTISYKLMKKYAAYNPSTKVKVVAGGDQNNFVSKYEGMLKQDATLVITTTDNNPEVRTYDNSHRWDEYPHYTVLPVTAAGGNTFKCEISDISQIKDIIAVKANNVEVSVEEPQPDTSPVPDDKVVDIFQLTEEENWALVHSGLLRTGVEDGKYYSYTYYVEEIEPEGYTASYTNNDGINTGTITITNTKEETEAKGEITLTKTGKDNAKLAGAKFDLYRFDLYRVKTGDETADVKINTEDLVTNADGEITVDNLEPGTYYFLETAAPAGYVTPEGDAAKTATKVVEAGKESLEPLEVSMTNTEEAKGVITLTKTGKDNAKLAGAKFDLYKVGEGLLAKDKKINTEDLVTDANGEITVEDLEPGTYYFKETEAPAGYVTPEGDAAKTETKVVEAGKESLEPLTVSMTNTYSAKGIGEIKVKKVLEGREWKSSDEFTFTISADEGTPMPENDSITIKKSDKDQTKSFGEIEFTEEGTYTYTVKETRGSISGVTYDESEHTVTIEAVDDGQGLIVPAEGSQLIQTEEFTNTYEAGATFGEILVQKVLNGREWKDSDEFEFTLSASGDAPMPENDTIVITKDDEDHIAGFGQIEFTEPGKYTYIVKETRGDEKGMTYDSKEHKVTLEVVDDGNGKLVAKSGTKLIQTVKITNTFSKGVKTGDSSNIVLYSVTSLSALILLLITYIIRRRENNRT